MNKSTVFSALVAALLTGACASGPSAPAPTATFNAADAKAQLLPGKGSIYGSGLLRQVGGGIVTCAGREVRLFPATTYAKQWFPYFFGYAKFAQQTADLTEFVPYANGFLSTSRVANCNAQGNYKFERVLDGDYVLHTIITWRVGRSSQGGTLVNYVTVRNGEDTEKMIVEQ